MRLLVILIFALVFSSISTAATDSNWGEQGGGYTQLPACTSQFYGVTLYVQDRWWRCIHSNPDHWIIVG